MTLDEQVRQALDVVADRVRDDLGRHLDVAATDLSRALESTQRSAIEAALVEARADFSRELEDACTNARREAEERLTGTFETERAAAIAQAALDATAAAESAAAEKLAAAERSASDRLTEVEQAVAERLRAGFDVERDSIRAERDATVESLRAERDAAADVAVSEAIAATECTVTERLSATFDSEREAFTLAAQETWAKAEREHAERAQADLQASVRLLAVIRKIDEGDSLSDILGTLANGAAVEAARAGVFIVEGIGLRSWRLAGFGDLGREGVIRPSESNGGIIVDAMRTATVVHKTEQAETSDFGGAGLSAIAVPLAIAGRVIAVLYADQRQAGQAQAGQAAQAGRPNWASAIEILGRHAGRALEALTAARLAEAATSVWATAGPNPLRSAVR